MVVCLIGLMGYGIYQKQHAHKKFLKKQTNLSLLNREKLLKKMRGTPPAWMQEQILEDFQDYLQTGISKEQVDAAFISSIHPYNVRYRVIDGELYRYFPEGEAISTEDNSTERALKTVIYLGKIKKMDFILSYLDGIFAQDALTSKAPLFFSAKQVSVPRVILIPDWRLTSRWWAKNIQELRDHHVPWEEKTNFALWRGDLTNPCRQQLCEIALDHPTLIDAKINVKRGEKEQKILEEKGLFGNRILFKEFLSAKYLPTLDGVCCASPALQWRLLANCVPFKQESDQVQWFYRCLKPYEHYIPVKNDLSDLIDQIEWAKEHDAECRQIAERGTQFAHANLMMEDIYLYFYLALKKYALLQTKISRHQLRKEVRTDPHWVNLHKRKKLEKGEVALVTPHHH